MFLSLVWYAVDARKWFKGPKINVEHLVHVPVFEAESNEPMETQKNGEMMKME